MVGMGRERLTDPAKPRLPDRTTFLPDRGQSILQPLDLVDRTSSSITLANSFTSVLFIILPCSPLDFGLFKRDKLVRSLCTSYITGFYSIGNRLEKV